MLKSHEAVVLWQIIHEPVNIGFIEGQSAHIGQVEQSQADHQEQSQQEVRQQLFHVAPFFL